MKPLWSVAVFLFLSVLCACSSHNNQATNPSSAASTMSLVGTEWVLRDLAGTPALAAPQATLAFSEAGGVTGSGSCNRFTGSVKISGNTLKFGPLASTRMACMDNGVSDQEDRYFKALGSATRYALENGDLLIYSDAAAKPLRFTRAAKSAS
jgi:heat shock protein HslJ